LLPTPPPRTSLQSVEEEEKKNAGKIVGQKNGKNASREAAAERSLPMGMTIHPCFFTFTFNSLIPPQDQNLQQLGQVKTKGKKHKTYKTKRCAHQ
jgi:hypothetical protein